MGASRQFAYNLTKIQRKVEVKINPTTHHFMSIVLPHSGTKTRAGAESIPHLFQCRSRNWLTSLLCQKGILTSQCFSHLLRRSGTDSMLPLVCIRWQAGTFICALGGAERPRVTFASLSSIFFRILKMSVL
jgi:hypothetical protein